MQNGSRKSERAPALTPAELDAVVGGINPQPLPPRHDGAVIRSGYIGETEKN